MQVSLQLDVSFGNVITLAPVKLFFPPLLDERVAVTVCPLETVITEKFEALVELDALTTRMKDLYDLQMILMTESFQAVTVAEALTRSFAARGTPQAQVPIILGADFTADPALTTRWQQYLRRTGLTAPTYGEVMALLGAFYSSLLLEGRRAGQWQGGHWNEPDSSPETQAPGDHLGPVQVTKPLVQITLGSLLRSGAQTGQ